MKVLALVTLGVLLASTSLGGGLGTKQASASTPNSVTIGAIGSPPLAALNPFDPVSDFTAVGIVYDYMFSMNWPPLPLITNLVAGGYSMNSAGTQYILSVKPNLKWSNGTPLNATDLQYTIYLYNESGDFSPAITSMSIINSTAVQITLASSDLYYIKDNFIGNGVAVLPYQVFSKVPFSNLSSFQNLNNVIGDGPFILSSSASANPLVMQANPYYWNGAPKLQTLYYYYYSTFSSEFNAFVSGQNDAVAYTGAYSGLQPIANVPGTTVIGPPYATPGVTVGAYLNAWVYPTNVSMFRLGLAYATNATFINEELNGPFSNNSVANQDFLIPQYNQQIGFSNGTGPVGYNYNVTKAEQIFVQAGFKYAGNTLEYPNGTSVSLSLKFRTCEPYSQSVTTLLSSEWAQVGILATPVLVPCATLRAGANNPNGWQVIVTGVLGPQTDNGVTPGPGVLSDIGDYWVNINGVHTSWNSTFYSITQQLATLQENSSQFNQLARTAATMYTQGVPIIPFFNVYNWAVVNNNYNWGSTSDYTGVYYPQALTGLNYFSLALSAVTPVSSSSSSSSVSTSVVTSTISGSVVTSTISGSVVTSTISGSVSTITQTSTITSKSSVAMSWSIIGIVLAIALAAGALLVMRRSPRSVPERKPQE